MSISTFAGKKLQRSHCCWRPEFLSSLLLLIHFNITQNIWNTYLFFKSICIWLVLRLWDIVFPWPWKARRLGNTFKSKLTRLISLPALFFCSAALRELCANLALLSRKIHSWALLSCLSHYGGESFALQPWQAASSPNKTTRPRAPSRGRGNNLHMPSTHITHREYIYISWSIHCLNR